tara:strand:+ start:550 stop:804 length:255 start_codon:yes stop_codon:yes gene_type:complete
MPILAIGFPGPWEMIIVFLIVLVFFGAGKLPQVFESFGKGMKSFRDAQKDDDHSESAATPKVIQDQRVSDVEELVDPATAKTEV